MRSILAGLVGVALLLGCDDAARDSDGVAMGDATGAAETASDGTTSDSRALEPDASAATDAVPSEGDSDTEVLDDGDDDDDDDAPAGAQCPAPPYGTQVGDTLADYELFTCDGAPYPLSSVCDRPLTYLNTYTGWCPPCQTAARAAPSDFAALLADRPDAAWLFVITEDGQGRLPDLAYCEAVRDAFGLPMTTLVDLQGELPRHLGVGSPNAWYVVLSAGLTLEAKIKYDKDEALELARDLGP